MAGKETMLLHKKGINELGTSSFNCKHTHILKNRFFGYITLWFLELSQFLETVDLWVPLNKTYIRLSEAVITYM